MPIPWLGIIDAVIGVTALARGRKSPASEQQLERRNIGGLETRLASVVVAALQEAFDRDTRRLELELLALELQPPRISSCSARRAIVKSAGCVCWPASPS